MLWGYIGINKEDFLLWFESPYLLTTKLFMGLFDCDSYHKK